MNSDALREHLEKLHRELSSVSRVDPASSKLLAELLQDIERLTDRTAAAPAAAQIRPSLPARLEELAVIFEARHPTLAASSRRLVDLLGNAGL